MPRWSNMIEDLVSRVTEIGSAMLDNNQANEQTLTQKCEALLSNLGEATGLARSKEILDDFKALDQTQKLAFFQTICQEFGVDQATLKAALEAWQENPDDERTRNIHFASEPRSQELVRRLNLAPGGTAALVRMREDLIRHMKEEPTLAALDKDIRHLFSSWFNRGFLRLERIDWSTSANILEKIIAYEAVHEIQGWDDLRRRVAAQDRRLYAFFHPSLVDEPLIFVEVALTSDMPDTIGTILAEERDNLMPQEASTAVFYSISNCQAGLRGISFGNFLIKQVVEELKRELPELKRFVTMSPVPGLRRWAHSDDELTEQYKDLIETLDQQETLFDLDFMTQQKASVSHLAARFLLEAKNKKGRPYDPVSNFHLGNGARLQQINVWADPSKRGQANSWGVMVNYEYDLDYIEKNHEAFLCEGIVSASSEVKRLGNAD